MSNYKAIACRWFSPGNCKGNIGIALFVKRDFDNEKVYKVYLGIGEGAEQNWDLELIKDWGQKIISVKAAIMIIYEGATVLDPEEWKDVIDTYVKPNQ